MLVDASVHFPSENSDLDAETLCLDCRFTHSHQLQCRLDFIRLAESTALVYFLEGAKYLYVVQSGGNWLHSFLIDCVHAAVFTLSLSCSLPLQVCSQGWAAVAGTPAGTDGQ